MPNIFFQSLGCPKNLVDTEVMLGISKKEGYAITPEPENADVIVVNTCSFINDSKRESIDAILEMSSHKTKGTCQKLIVTGCLPQRYKADLKVSFPEVDAFVGTGQYNRLFEFVDGLKEDDTGFRSPKYIHNENTPRINSQPAHRAYLKISEGCIKNCAFCIIPRIRGTLRSRTVDSLYNEASQLVAGGVRELNLIAQDLTDYAKELRDGSSLLSLLKKLETIPSLEWIRMLYVYPDELHPELIRFIRDSKKVAKYIDMPIQHINDRMLQLMNRRISGSLIRKRIENLRELIPNVSLRTGVIVGYPGETEAEFQELVSFVKEGHFNHLGVFAYSHEENTASFSLPDQIDEETKQNRRERLLKVQQKVSQSRLAQWVGREIDVLVEGPAQDIEYTWQGRHQGQAPDIDGQVLLAGGPYNQGEFVRARVESSLEYDLIATPLELQHEISSVSHF